MLPAATKRFAKLVNRPGGATLAEAVRAADANLDGMRDTARAEIATTLDRMHVLGAAMRSAPSDAVTEELYGLSNSIVGVAGLFGLPHLGAVAYSLCELIDRLRAAGRSSPSAIQVHLDSLRHMQIASPGAVEQANAVQRALQQVVNSIPRSAKA